MSVQDEEVAMLSELSHLQEVVDQLEKHTADPYTLPPASEQVHVIRSTIIIRSGYYRNALVSPEYLVGGDWALDLGNAET